MNTETPVYERNKPAKNKAELDGIWDIAKEDARELDEEEAMKAIAELVANDMEL